MEKTNIFDYVSSNSYYYEQPRVDTCENFSLEVPSGWNHLDNGLFTYVSKNENEDQGFKIHISSTYEDSQSVLNLVFPYLIKKEISFKYVNNKKTYKNSISKNGIRTFSGKFITVYPNSNVFLKTLKELHELTKFFKKGPYILTDKRYKDGNIFFRYGAFKEILNEYGEHCIQDEDGNLILDVREPEYHLPSFVKEPKELYEEDEEEDENSPFYKYEFTEVLKFSNAGGVYVAHRKSDNKKVLIKEARQGILSMVHTNLTAEELLKDEYDSLLKLKDVKGVVNPIEFFKVWESSFLVEEFIEGLELETWIPAEYDFYNKNYDAYFEKSKKILENLYKVLLEIHSFNIAICDLQTRNIIVTENLDIKIIDLETATNTESNYEKGLTTEGFYHELAVKPICRDFYALNRIATRMFLPLTSMFNVVGSLENIKYISWIRENLREDIYKWFITFQKKVISNIEESYKIFKNCYNFSHHSYNKENFQSVYNKILNGFLENININSDSLISGSIAQFEEDCGKYNLKNGGFGAVLLLNRANLLTDDIIKWVNRAIVNINENKYNEGFLTGLSGIALTLYEIGFKDDAIKLIKKIKLKNEKRDIDLSFSSGYAGIGLAYALMYNETKDEYFLEKSKEVSDYIFINYKDYSKQGFLEGRSGISFFASIMYSITKEEKYKELSIELIKQELLETEIKEDILFVHYSEVNQNNPYLDKGTVGIALAIYTLNLYSNENHFQNEFELCLNILNFLICKENSLFSGLSGFFLLNSMTSKKFDLINKLNAFSISNNGFNYITDSNGIKFSSDLETGSAGVLLGLLSLKNVDTFIWLPLRPRKVVIK